MISLAFALALFGFIFLLAWPGFGMTVLAIATVLLAWPFVRAFLRTDI